MRKHTGVERNTMAQKPIHHGNSPSPSGNFDDKSRTPPVGGFVASTEPDITPLFQESVEVKMRLLANAIIDRMLEEKRNGTLSTKIHTSDCDSSG